MKLDLAELKKQIPTRATLTALQKRLQVKTVLAVTLESGRVAVALMRRDDKGVSVVRSFEMQHGAEAVMANAEKIGAELGSQLNLSGIRERRCVVCLPASWALSTATDLPEISKEDLPGYLELRAEREFPAAAADLRLSHCTYFLPDGKERATIAAVPAKRLDAVERMLAAAGCRAVSISLGLDGCMPHANSKPALHFLANGTHVDLVVASGGGIAAVRSLPGAAKPDASDFDAAGFSREVRITLGRLPDGIRQQVREARFGGTPESAMHLRQEMSQHLDRMGIYSLLEEKSDSAQAGEHPPAAIAAAEHHLRQRPVVFEFLPPQVNRWQVFLQRFDSKRRRWMVAAALAIIVLPILVFFIRSRMESSLTSEWNGMRRNVADLESLQQRLRQFRPWFEPAPQALQVLDGLIAAFPEQGDVWAKSIQMDENNKVTCSGFARAQSGILSILDRLRSRPDVTEVQVQQMRGANPVQFTFTFKSGAHDAK
jgi:hypothetical protein